MEMSEAKRISRRLTRESNSLLHPRFNVKVDGCVLFSNPDFLKKISGSHFTISPGLAFLMMVPIQLSLLLIGVPFKA